MNFFYQYNLPLNVLILASFHLVELYTTKIMNKGTFHLGEIQTCEGTSKISIHH